MRVLYILAVKLVNVEYANITRIEKLKFSNKDICGDSLNVSLVMLRSFEIFHGFSGAVIYPFDSQFTPNIPAVVCIEHNFLFQNFQIIYS